MSPKSSYQRHTPGRVPFENAFSWQEEPCSQRIAALSEECRAHDGHRNLDENQKVEFDLAQGPKGPQAANIRQA